MLSIPNVNTDLVSVAKVTMPKKSAKEYWSIGHSNQTGFDLINIIEYCEHLTAGVVLNIV